MFLQRAFLLGDKMSDSNALATARWADPDYISDRYYFRPGDIWIGRNPHNFDQAIGYRDDRHVLVCAGSRSGKGRSFIVNNLALWPGSAVVYDPKGELPSILAPRRGHEGDAYCDGMGQEVFVLDPLNHADVDAKYRAFFDPLSGLDREDRDGELATWAKRIADSLIQYDPGTEASEWAKRAVRLTALIIMHVVTERKIPDDKRNLITVLHLVLEGAEDVFENLRRRLDPKMRDKIPDPMIILLDEMIENGACRGWIAREARSLKRQAELTPRYFESVRGEAADKLDWFKSAGIERTITGGINGVQEMAPSRQFDPRTLKTDPRGVSVFIVLPIDDLKTYGPWLEAVFTGIFASIRQVRGKPASGHQILGVLDEFSSLGYQEYIASSMDNIAGAGMKLAIILQNFGKLKDLYGDEMESFFSNAGLEIYFGKIGQAATDYISRELGETEIVKFARNFSSSRSESQTASQADSYGQTEGDGGSRSTTQSQSSAQSRGRGWNWSSATNWSDARNWGKSEGRSMGRNYGPHIFFEGLEHSNNYGTSLSSNRGGAHTKGGSKVKGGSRSEQFTDTQGTSETIGSSWNRSTTTTRTFTDSHTEGYQIGEGVAESFHKKPLLEAHEINSYLRPLSEEDLDHPAFPGLALVRIQGEEPFLVRRSNYDQDPYFERTFSVDPVHGYIPLSHQPMLGYQYTQEHLLEFSLPEQLVGAGYIGKALARRFQWVDHRTEIYELPADHEHFYPPCRGRVVGLTDDPCNPKLALRLDHVVDGAKYLLDVFKRHIEKVNEQTRLAEKAAEAARRAAEEEARKSDITRRIDARISEIAQLEHEDEEFMEKGAAYWIIYGCVLSTLMLPTPFFIVPIVAWGFCYKYLKPTILRRVRLEYLYNNVDI